MEYIDGIKVKKCVGCGFCCIKTRCSTSLRIWQYTNENQCPGLIWNGERYICKLAAMDGPKGVEYRAELYIGDGCCCGLNDWRLNVIPRRDCDVVAPKTIKYTLDKAFAAFLNALGTCFMSGDAMFLALRGMAVRLESQGMQIEEIEAIINEVNYHYKEHRPNYQKEFMG